MSSKVAGIVFDADGTLFDTASVIYDAYCHLAEVHGHPQPTRQQVAKQMGQPIPEIIAALFPGADVPAMMETNSTFFMKQAAKVAAFHGLDQLLDELQDRGIQLGILTSGTDKVHAIIERNDLASHFKSVVHSDRIDRHKPDPQGLHLAATELGVPVANVVMVGDMPQDIQVAANAGALASVGITHGFSTRDVLYQSGANYVIDTLPELLDVLATIERGHGA